MKETIKAIIQTEGKVVLESNPGVGKNIFIKELAEEMGLEHKHIIATHFVDKYDALSELDSCVENGVELIILDEVVRANLSVLDGILSFEQKFPKVKIAYLLTGLNPSFATPIYAAFMHWIQMNRIKIMEFKLS